MFELCSECRKAFNFSEAVDSAEVTSRDSQPWGAYNVEAPAGRNEEAEGGVAVREPVVRDGEGSEVDSDESLSSGNEGGPSCKRSRVEESLPTSPGTSPSESEREGTVEQPKLEEEKVPSGEPDCGNTPTDGRVLSETASDETPTSKGGASRGTDAMATQVCSSCLGLLDDQFINTLTTDVRSELDKARYEGVKTFSLSISTPLSLILRQCGVMFYLKENFETIDELTAPPEAYVKESLRCKLYSRLKTQLSPLKSDVESPFQIILKLDHSSSSTEGRLAAETWPDAFKDTKKKKKWKRRGKRKKRTSENETIVNTNSINRALVNATAQDFEKHDFLSAAGLCSYVIEFSHSPLYVGGRYCKYSRDLPQTPWFIGDVRKAETSVQELICNHIQEVVRSYDVKFSSSGREDCDVRMLGKGRPFLVELLNPKKTELEISEVEELQSKINSSTKLVEVKRLQMMTKSAAISLKEGEEEKRKEYRALVWAPEAVTQDKLDQLGVMTDVVIHQKTPIRVLHRRSLATRDRTVHTMSAKLVNEHHFFLSLTTQAGTYVKEFVHGDFGRTQPNLRTIMEQEVDILTLDVCDVLLEWPPTQVEEKHHS